MIRKAPNERFLFKLLEIMSEKSRKSECQKLALLHDQERSSSIEDLLEDSRKFYKYRNLLRRTKPSEK